MEKDIFEEYYERESLDKEQMHTKTNPQLSGIIITIIAIFGLGLSIFFIVDFNFSILQTEKLFTSITSSASSIIIGLVILQSIYRSITKKTAKESRIKWTTIFYVFGIILFLLNYLIANGLWESIGLFIG